MVLSPRAALLGLSLLSSSSALADAVPGEHTLRLRQSPGHPHTLASPHIGKEHGGLDVRVRPNGRVVLRSYNRIKVGYAIQRKNVRSAAIVDPEGDAARDSFHIVRRAMIVRNHFGLDREKMIDVAFDAAMQAAAGATKLSEIFTAATDAIVAEMKTADRWAAVMPEAYYVAKTTPAANNVSSHRLPGDVLAVRVHRFHGPVAQQIAERLAAARAERPVRGLVLDLRDNGGGNVAEVHAILSQFLPDGTTLFTTELGRLGRPLKSEPLLAKAPAGGPDTALPIAVLVNGRSASASELTVGVLKDQGRATLIGDRTYGKGVGQPARRLPDGRIFKQTEWRRVLPRLGPYHGLGIEPDVTSEEAAQQVAVAAAEGKLRDRGDTALRAALLALWGPAPGT